MALERYTLYGPCDVEPIRGNLVSWFVLVIDHVKCGWCIQQGKAMTMLLLRGCDAQACISQCSTC